MPEFDFRGSTIDNKRSEPCPSQNSDAARVFPQPVEAVPFQNSIAAKVCPQPLPALPQAAPAFQLAPIRRNHIPRLSR
jgi:hypothetical protein